VKKNVVNLLGKLHQLLKCYTDKDESFVQARRYSIQLIIGITDTRQKRHALKWRLLRLVGRREAEWFTNSPILYCITGINLGVALPKSLLQLPTTKQSSTQNRRPYYWTQLFIATTHLRLGLKTVAFQRISFRTLKREQIERDTIRTRVQIPQTYRTLFPLTLYGCEA
jgi:hypothetical protein